MTQIGVYPGEHFKLNTLYYVHDQESVMINNTVKCSNMSSMCTRIYTHQWIPWRNIVDG